MAGALHNYSALLLVGAVAATQAIALALLLASLRANTAQHMTI
jgi:hypothetical protein